MSTSDPILSQGIQQLKTDIGLTHEIVHGDENTVVQTEGGPVRSMAKLQKDNQDIINSFIPEVNSREPSANGDTANGFPRLNNFKLAVLNAANGIKTYFVGRGTQERNLLLPDKDGTVALLSDITGTNTGINTGDETKATILNKLGVPSLSGVNTGDQTLDQLGGQPLLGFDPVDTAMLGQANGVATLDDTGKVPSGQLPSYVDDVLEFDSVDAFPPVGERGKIYVPTDTNEQYRWTGSFYLKLVGSPGTTDAVPEGSVNKYFTESRVLNTLLTGYSVGVNAVLSATDSVRGAFGKLQKQISDILPILALKANSDSPTFTGTVTVPNLASDNSSQQAVNSLFVQTLVTNLYNQIQGGSPAALNTLAKLAASIGNDPNYITTVNNQLALCELLANKTTSFGTVNDVLYPTVKAVKSYVDGSLVKVVIDCGGWDASSNLWPEQGGTGAGGAVVRGNLWFVNGAGQLGGQAVNVGDSFRALVDSPGQDPANWAIMEHNVNYTPANQAGDTFGFINVTNAGRALAMIGNTTLSKSVGVGNGSVQMDIGLESINGGDLVTGAASYGASWNTSGGSLNFGVQSVQRMVITDKTAKIISAGVNTVAGTNNTLSLMHTVAGRDVSLELGDGTNPSVKLSQVAGVMYFYVNGAVRAKIGTDGIMVVDTIKTNAGETYWHTGTLKPGAPNGIAQLGADGKLDNSQVPTTDKVAEGATNLYFTEPRVLATKLTGYAVAVVNAALAAGDSVLVAFGKIQKQFNDLTSRTTTLETNNTGVNTGDETQARILNKLGATTVTGSNTGDETRATIVSKLGSTDNLPEGGTNLYFTQARAVASVLTGYATAAVNAVVAATDTVMGAIGKLQKQISDLSARTTGTNTGDETQASIVGKLGYTPVNPNQLGVANGIATLDSGGKVPATQLPSYVDDVVEGATSANFPGTGETGKIYVALDTNKTYRWGGSSYVEISASPGSTDAVPEGSTNKYFTSARVLSTVLSGLSTATNAVVSAADTVLSGIGKLQAQFSELSGRTTGTNTGDETRASIVTKLGNTDALPEGGTNLYFTQARAVAAVLTGYAVAAVNAVVAATDTVSVAIGKLQKQISDLAARTTGTNTGDETQTTIFNKIGYTPMNPANIGNYAPSLTGGGASGTWSINITGNAGSASNASQLGSVTPGKTMQKRRYRISSADGTSLNSSISSLETGFTYGGSGEVTGPFIHFGGLGGDADYGCQIVADYNSGNTIMWRTRNDDSSVWNPWKTLWHSGNLTLSVTAAGNTVVYRDANGYIFGTYINMTDDGTTGGNGNGGAVTGMLVKQGDNYYRTVSAALVKTFLDIAPVTSAGWNDLVNNRYNMVNVTYSGYITESVITVTANTATTVLDLSLGSIFKVTIAANTTITFDLSKIPAAKLTGKQLGFALITINDATAGRGVAFGTTISWTDGVAPQRTTAANARDDWYFYTDTGAAPLIGSLSNANVK